MVFKPAAVVFVNDDLTSSVQSMLVTQLQISEVIDGYAFDARLAANPDYVAVVKQLDLRIMVIRPFTELQNRTEADVVCFVSHGLVAILQNKFGPHGQTHSVVNLYWGKLSIF